jgi:hypothetical protein
MNKAQLKQLRQYIKCKGSNFDCQAATFGENSHAAPTILDQPVHDYPGEAAAAGAKGSFGAPLCKGGTADKPIPDPCIKRAENGAYAVRGARNGSSLRYGPYDCAALIRLWREEDRLLKGEQ